MTEQLIPALTGLTAVGHSDDDLVKVKIAADGRPVGFKLAADRPALSPERTLALAMQALKDAHDSLAAQADELVATTAPVTEATENVTAFANRESDSARDDLERLERFALDIRSELGQTMDRLGNLLRR